MLIGKKLWMHLVQLLAQSGTIANTDLLVNIFSFFLNFKLSLPSCNICCLLRALLSAAIKKCLALLSL